MVLQESSAVDILKRIFQNYKKFNYYYTSKILLTGPVITVSTERSSQNQKLSKSIYDLAFAKNKLNN